MISQLLIKRPTDTTYTQVDLFDELPYSITYSVADIRNPENRNGSYSKTINIAGSKNNNILFEFIFNVNSNLQTFDPNLKCDAIINHDGIEVFKGNLQLIQIHVFDKDSISYDVAVYGNTKSIFDSISNKYLTDTNLSAYNHIRNKTNIANSWSAAIGSGYVYPLINNGLDNVNAPTPAFTTTNMFPCTYVKSIVDGIFADAGFSYSSTFFTSTLFKSLIVPSIGKTGGHKATLTLAINISNVAIDIGGGFGNVGVGIIVGAIKMIRTNAVNGTTHLLATTVFHGAGAGSTNYTLTANDVILNQGDTVYILFSVGNPNNTLKWTVNTATWTSVYEDGTGSFTGFVTTPATYQPTGTNPNLTYQSETDPNSVLNIATGVHTVPAFAYQNYLPDKILQRDFLLGIIRMFNLYFEVDKDTSNKLLIEPRDDYYSAGATKDWTQKWAVDRETMITPLGELDTRQFLFQYTPANDFFNNLYTKGDVIGAQTYTGWQETYGQHIKNITNDFVHNVKTIQPVFSPTLLSNIGSTNIILPSILTKQPTTNAPNGIDDNGIIRILYYGGLKTGTFSLSDFSGATTYTTYPYCGHLDDVQNPTVDIQFGTPKQVFYAMTNPALYTDNNLYNAYWKKAITEMPDKDSKLVTAWFYLTPTDIQLLDFRDTIKVDEQYYKINKVINYSPTTTDLTQVELTKMNAAVPFVASNTSILAAVLSSHISSGANTNTIPHSKGHHVIVHGGNNAFNTTNAIIYIG